MDAAVLTRLEGLRLVLIGLATEMTEGERYLRLLAEEVGNIQVLIREGANPKLDHDRQITVN